LALAVTKSSFWGGFADPYGIRGWLRLYPFGDDPLALGRNAGLVGSKEGEPWRECRLKGLKAHGDGLVVVLLDGVFEDRTAAEAMKGLLVGAPRDALPTTEKG
jgi:16S rRNA processing protein RimM